MLPEESLCPGGIDHHVHNVAGMEGQGGEHDVSPEPTVVAQQLAQRLKQHVRHLPGETKGCKDTFPKNKNNKKQNYNQVQKNPKEVRAVFRLRIPFDEYERQLKKKSGSGSYV